MHCHFWTRDFWVVIAASMEPIVHPDAGTGAMWQEDIMLVLTLINGIGLGGGGGVDFPSKRDCGRPTSAGVDGGDQDGGGESREDKANGSKR